jgi:hypothetical protein
VPVDRGVSFRISPHRAFSFVGSRSGGTAINKRSAEVDQHIT